MIDSYRSYVPFWLHGVVGAELRPDITGKPFALFYRYNTYIFGFYNISTRYL